MSVRSQRRPHGAFWGNPEDALGFIDSRLGNGDGVRLVQDLLRGMFDPASLSMRRISDEQLASLHAGRVLPLISSTWDMPTSFDATERMQLAIWGLQLDAAAIQTTDLLGTADIPCVLLKGLATSHLDYPRPEMRHSGDIDVLVHDADLERASEVLTSNGCIPMHPRPFDATFDKGISFINEDQIEIDVHTRLSAHIPSSGAGLFTNTVPLHLSARALSVEHRLVHAASHLFFSAPGRRRLSGLADIYAIRSNGVDLEAVRDAARALDVEGSTFVGLSAEGSIVGRDNHVLAEWKRPSRLESLAYARSRRMFGAEQLLRIAGVSGWSDRARFLRQRVLPSRAVMEHRGGPVSYVRMSIRGR